MSPTVFVSRHWIFSQNSICENSIYFQFSSQDHNLTRFGVMHLFRSNLIVFEPPMKFIISKAAQKVLLEYYSLQVCLGLIHIDSLHCDVFCTCLWYNSHQTTGEMKVPQIQSSNMNKALQTEVMWNQFPHVCDWNTTDNFKALQDFMMSNASYVYNRMLLKLPSMQVGSGAFA